jgi:signal transduction histidine kinase
MSAAEIANLFVPFRRAPDLADSIPGSGLGLSIVQRIVNAHGGRIDVESTPGAGSVFRVRLPRQAKEKPA